MCSSDLENNIREFRKNFTALLRWALARVVANRVDRTKENKRLLSSRTGNIGSLPRPIRKNDANRNPDSLAVEISKTILLVDDIAMPINIDLLKQLNQQERKSYKDKSRTNLNNTYPSIDLRTRILEGFFITFNRLKVFLRNGSVANSS